MNNNKIIDFSKNFIKEFKPIVFIAIFCVIYFYINSVFYNQFQTNKITALIRKSKFAGNAFFINKTQLLTTYDLVEKTCKKNQDSRNAIFILFKNNYYKVDVLVKDPIYNLAVLEMGKYDSAEAKIKNYAIITNRKSEKNEKAFYFVNKNKPFKSFLKNKTILNVSENVSKIKIFDFLRKYYGSPVLDKNLSLYGIITGNSGKILKTLDITNSNLIKDFLDNNSIRYSINKNNMNLFKITNYKDEINAQVICIPDTSRLSSIIKLNN